MLGLAGFVSSAPYPLGASPWKLWVDHTVKQKDKYSIKKATLVYTDTGGTAAASTGFNLSQKEVQKLCMVFKEMNNNFEDGMRISVKDKTYMVKSASGSQVIAFNGGRYIIATRSKTMVMVALCDSKAHHEDAAKWLTRLCAKLIEKNF